MIYGACLGPRPDVSEVEKRSASCEPAGLGEILEGAINAGKNIGGVAPGDRGRRLVELVLFGVRVGQSREGGVCGGFIASGRQPNGPGRIAASDGVPRPEVERSGLGEGSARSEPTSWLSHAGGRDEASVAVAEGRWWRTSSKDETQRSAEASRGRDTFVDLAGSLPHRPW